MSQCCIWAGCEDYFILRRNCIDFKLKEEKKNPPVGQTLLEDSDKPPCYLCYLCGEICRCCKRHLEATGFMKYLKWGSEIIEILMPPWQHWRILKRRPSVWLENWGFGSGCTIGNAEKFKGQYVIFVIVRFKASMINNMPQLEKTGANSMKHSSVTRTLLPCCVSSGTIVSDGPASDTQLCC